MTATGCCPSAFILPAGAFICWTCCTGWPRLCLFSVCYTRVIAVSCGFMSFRTTFGVWLYFWAFSVTTQRFVVMLLEIVRRLTLIVNSILRILIVLPVLALYRLLRKLVGWTWALIVFLGRMLIYILMPVWKPILWLIGPLKARWKTPESLVKLGIRLKNTAKRWFGRR